MAEFIASIIFAVMILGIAVLVGMVSIAEGELNSNERMCEITNEGFYIREDNICVKGEIIFDYEALKAE